MSYNPNVEITGEPIRALGDLAPAISTDGPEFDSSLAIFRGQLSVTHTLVPSVYRGPNRKREQTLTNRFRLHAPSRMHNPPEQADFAGWLTLMRHYGLPSRLLDWTESALFALFFAVTPMNGDDPEDDAALWALEAESLNFSQTRRREVEILNSRSEAVLAAFDSKQRTGTQVVATMAPENSSRMMVQRSLFTIHTTQEPIEVLPQASTFLRRHVIPRESIATIRTELETIGLNRRHLFPDIEGLAASLIEWWHNPQERSDREP